jgi:fibro-slime domain-containing protein
VDTSVFPQDNREPILISLNNENTGIPCYSGFDDFKDWYNDNPSKNRSFYTDLVLTNSGDGIYTYTNMDFFPLDPGAGWQKFNPTDPNPFGPEARLNSNHVFGFTMELHSVFTYTAGQGQTFSFSGDDDVWVFINGKLVIDLGGLHPQLNASVDLDQRASFLGLVDGGNYPLDFFFAERHSTASRCQISTSLQLVQKENLPNPVATPSGQVFENVIQVGLSVPGIQDAVIRYTLDGTDPNETSSIFSVALNFSSTTILKAKGYHPNYEPSSILTETYTLQPPPIIPDPPPLVLPVPVATPPGGEFRDSLRVTLAVPGHPLAEIHYTLDGSMPTQASPLYSSPLPLGSTVTLKAQAWEPNWLPSPNLTEVYTYIPPPNVVTLALERPISRPVGGLPTFGLPISNHPIVIVSENGGVPVCLACPPGTESLALTPTEFPEWVVSSREPFQFNFSIYDNLGNFVVTQTGSVSAEMLSRAMAIDANGYRLFRFRWIPVAEDGRAIGTGAYILRAQVISPSLGIAGATASESSFIKTLGYLRAD